MWKYKKEIFFRLQEAKQIQLDQANSIYVFFSKSH